MIFFRDCLYCTRDYLDSRREMYTVTDPKTQKPVELDKKKVNSALDSIILPYEDRIEAIEKAIEEFGICYINDGSKDSQNTKRLVSGSLTSRLNDSYSSVFGPCPDMYGIGPGQLSGIDTIKELDRKERFICVNIVLID